jgi:hypothetical protein
MQGWQHKEGRIEQNALLHNIGMVWEHSKYSLTQPQHTQLGGGGQGGGMKGKSRQVRERKAVVVVAGVC